MKATQAVVHLTRAWLLQQQHRPQVIADENRREIFFDIGNWVLLHTDAHCGSDGPYKNIHPVDLGPYKVVEKVRESAVELDLPSITKQHRAIHVRWLKLYLEPDVLYPKEPPRNELEAAAWYDEISVTAGIPKDYLHVVWQDCKPEHSKPISFDFRLFFCTHNINLFFHINDRKYNFVILSTYYIQYSSLVVIWGNLYK